MAITLEAVLSQILLPRRDGTGRVCAVEIMLANYAIRNLIRENKLHQVSSVIETSSNQGMQTLDHSLEDLVRKGVVDAEEALLRAQRPEEIEKSLKPYLVGQKAKAGATARDASGSPVGM